MLVESICNAGGLGFNGYDDKGNEQWDLVRGIDVYKLEFPTNARDVVLAWNICTTTWLRRLVLLMTHYDSILFTVNMQYDIHCGGIMREVK